MALTQQVERRLCDADVRLDADDGDLVGHLGALGEGVAEFGDEHGEGGLVNSVERGVVEFGADWGEKAKSFVSCVSRGGASGG